MTIIAAVKKGGKIAIGCDTLTCIGDDRKMLPMNLVNCDKLYRIADMIVANRGLALSGRAFEHYVHRLNTLKLDNPADIFDTFVDFRGKLKNYYGLAIDELEDEDLADLGGIGAEFLIVNPYGIFIIDADLCVTKHSRWAAIGTGAPYALGAIHVTYYDVTESAETICETAIGAACAFDLYCGGKHIVEQIDCHETEKEKA